MVGWSVDTNHQIIFQARIFIYRLYWKQLDMGRQTNMYQNLGCADVNLDFRGPYWHPDTCVMCSEIRPIKIFLDFKVWDLELGFEEFLSWFMELAILQRSHGKPNLIEKIEKTIKLRRKQTWHMRGFRRQQAYNGVNIDSIWQRYPPTYQIHIVSRVFRKHSDVIAGSVF